METVQAGQTPHAALKSSVLDTFANAFSRYSYTICALAILVTGSIGVALAIHVGRALHYADEIQYVSLADHLLRTHIFTINGIDRSAWRPPGFAWFLLPPLWLHASVVTLRIYNLSALLVAQLFLFLLVQELCSKSAGALAVLLSMAYPVLPYSAVLLFPQTFAAALLLCSLWIVLGGATLTWQRAVCSGAVLGLLILTIPAFLPIAAVLFLLLVLKRVGSTVPLGILVVTCALIVGAWTARNYVALHRFVFVATNGGVNLLLGNSDQATPTSGSLIDISAYGAKGHQMSEVDADHFYAASAKQWIAQHPARAFVLYVGKLIHYFGFSDQLSAGDEKPGSLFETVAQLGMVVSYGFLLSVFFARLVLLDYLRLSFSEVCFAVIYLFNALFAALFFTRIRLRLPLDWLLLAFVAMTLWRSMKANAFSRNLEIPIST